MVEISPAKIFSPKITTLQFHQKQFTSPEEAERIGNLEVYSFLKEDEACKKFLLAPISSPKGKNIVLYWDGGKNIPGGEKTYSYFRSRGCKEVSQPHPSDLVHAMAELSEWKLTQLGIPSYVSIILLTPKEFLFRGMHSDLSLLWVFRRGGNRVLNLANFCGDSHGSMAFLVEEQD